MTDKKTNTEEQIKTLRRAAVLTNPNAYAYPNKIVASFVNDALAIIEQLQEQNKNQAQTIKAFRDSALFGEFEGYKLKEHDDWNVRLEEKGGDLVIIKKSVFLSQLNNFFKKIKSPSKTTLKQITFLNK